MYQILIRFSCKGMMTWVERCLFIEHLENSLGTSFEFFESFGIERETFFCLLVWQLEEEMN